MSQNGSNLIRALLLSACLSSAFAPAAVADIVELSPIVPAADAVYSLQNTCILQVCLGNMVLTDFTPISGSISGGNEVTLSNVDLKANVFQNNSGTPGSFIAPIVMTGEIGITYFSKTLFSEQGTFDTLITSLDLKGTFTGLTGPHTVEAILNPNEQSTGQTTVTPLGGTPATWQIGSFFDVFAELSVDGGTFVPGPERTADLEPEPLFYVPVGIGLAGLMGIRWRKARTKSLATQS